MTTTHRIGTGVALALALAASAVPASARPFDLNANGSYVPAGSASMQAASRPAATPTSTGPRSDVSSTNGYDFARVPPTVVRIVSRDSGFGWGDAGIGAAGGLGLALVSVGGAFAISQQRRTRRSKTSEAITS